MEAVEDVFEFGGEVDVVFAVFGEGPSRRGGADVEGEEGGVEDLVINGGVDLADDVSDGEAGEGEAGGGGGGGGDDPTNGEEVVEGGGVERGGEAIEGGGAGVVFRPNEGGDDEVFGAKCAWDFGGEAEIGEHDGGVEFVGVAEIKDGEAVEVGVVPAFDVNLGDVGRLIGADDEALDLGIEEDFHGALVLGDCQITGGGWGRQRGGRL